MIKDIIVVLLIVSIGLFLIAEVSVHNPANTLLMLGENSLHKKPVERGMSLVGNAVQNRELAMGKKKAFDTRTLFGKLKPIKPQIRIDSGGKKGSGLEQHAPFDYTACMREEQPQQSVPEMVERECCIKQKRYEGLSLQTAMYLCDLIWMPQNCIDDKMRTGLQRDVAEKYCCIDKKVLVGGMNEDQAEPECTTCEYYKKQQGYSPVAAQQVCNEIIVGGEFNFERCTSNQLISGRSAHILLAQKQCCKDEKILMQKQPAIHAEQLCSTCITTRLENGRDEYTARFYCCVDEKTVGRGMSDDDAERVCRTEVRRALHS